MSNLSIHTRLVGHYLAQGALCHAVNIFGVQVSAAAVALPVAVCGTSCRILTNLSAE